MDDLVELLCSPERISEERFSPEEMLSLWQNGGLAVHYHLAIHADATPDLLWRLARSHRIDTVRHVSRRAGLPRDLQQHFAEHLDPYLRADLARNKGLIPEIQELLVRDVADVRRILASNPTLLPVHQETLSRDPDLEVRLALSSNSSLSVDQQEVLAEDDSTEVQGQLAANPALAPHLQQSFARCEHRLVRACLAQNTSLDYEIQARFATDAETLPFLAQNGNLDLRLQWQLSTNVSDRVRESLAAKTKDPALHERFAVDDDSSVRKQLADNSSCHPAAQLILAQDTDLEVLAVLAYHKNLSQAAQELLSFSTSAEVESTLRQRKETVLWSERFNAQFVKATNLSYYQEFVTALPEEVVASFMQNWEGSLEDLAEACRLVQV